MGKLLLFCFFQMIIFSLLVGCNSNFKSQSLSKGLNSKNQSQAVLHLSVVTPTIFEGDSAQVRIARDSDAGGCSYKYQLSAREGLIQADLTETIQFSGDSLESLVEIPTTVTPGFQESRQIDFNLISAEGFCELGSDISISISVEERQLPTTSPRPTPRVSPTISPIASPRPIISPQPSLTPRPSSSPVATPIVNNSIEKLGGEFYGNPLAAEAAGHTSKFSYQGAMTFRAERSGQV